MDLEKLKKNLTDLKGKYSDKKGNILDYYNKMIEAIMQYEEDTGDERFDKEIPCVVFGEDLYGSDYCEEVCDVSKDLYIFNGWNNISKLDFDDINEIIDKSLTKITKEKTFEI